MTLAHTVSDGSRTSWLRLLPSSMLALVEAPMRNPRLWTSLAWMDIVQSYRRTVLGPAWITVNLVIFTIAMTLVYGALFSVPTKDYAAFLVCGMIAWFWIAALLQEVGNTFLNYSHFIKSTSINKAFFLWVAVFRQAIILAHHMVVYVVLVMFGVIPFTVHSFAFIPALLTLFLISIPFTAIVAILFARFRDLSRLVASLIIVLMMVTPIFWQPNMLAGWRATFVHLNPFYYIIEFIRTPLLGRPLDPTVVAVVVGMGIIFWILGAEIYRRYQKYVVFWL